MKPFLAALAVSISFTSFAGGSVVVGDTQRRESSLSEEPHYSDTGITRNAPVQRMELGAGSTPAHQQPVPQGAVTAPLSRAAGTRGENPGKKWPLIGRVQTASLVALALADYDSTQRGLARGGREVGLVLSCGGQLCQGRYTAINAGVVLGTYAITRYAIPRLPQRWRRVTNIMLSGMITGRGFIVVQNYRKAARIK